MAHLLTEAGSFRLRPRDNEVFVTMYERFTDKALKVLELADQEARRFNCEYIGTEHLLLGLVKEGTGVAAFVVKNFDIDLTTIRLEVERILRSFSEMKAKGKLPMSPRAQKVLEYSMEESRILNHDYVGTEHILLGLLRVQDGVAAQVLMSLGLKVADVREEILKMLSGSTEFVPLHHSRLRSSSPLIYSGASGAGSKIGSLRSEEQETSRLFRRFTDRARKVMQLANQEAQRFNHEYIGTEHILLGLAKMGSGVAAIVLKNLDVDIPKIHVEVDKLVGSGQAVVTGNLPLTPRARVVIEYAMKESFNLGNDYVGTQHLLLGLLRETEGVAAQVLMNLGVNLEEVRQEILNLLGHGL